eukprot:TRINITY_DN4334_c0_g1_i1.p1 TRINITY_DN4334_c0_g1~~TRINITY_DN4334_c0_g1_i1.p1  ORF type:complete len:346 (+),score=76.91 TRINITY_DN4334_c0_g1_i1:75-1112(+)
MSKIIPLSSDNSETYFLGVDEAGRGPVLGSLVYCVAWCTKAFYDDPQGLKKLGVRDSKELKTESARESLYAKIISSEKVSFITDSLQPQFLSQSMLSVNNYNLNAISRDSVVNLIKQVQKLGYPVEHIYIDTLGPPDKYQQFLLCKFPEYINRITVSKKADSLFPIVSAASICAKVTRDRNLNAWQFEETHIEDRHFGCGYPSDPLTRNWLKRNVDQVFGFPSLVRFSWKTSSELLEKFSAVEVSWEADEKISEKEEPKSKNKKLQRKSSRYHLSTLEKRVFQKDIHLSLNIFFLVILLSQSHNLSPNHLTRKYAVILKLILLFPKNKVLMTKLKKEKKREGSKE